MSGTGVLLDSCIIIDHLNGISAATSYLSGVGTTGHVSAITRAEVLTGVSGEAQHTVAQFLDCFPFIPIDKEVTDLAAALRQIHGWRLPDAIQAAAAQHHKLRLATRNTGDFDPGRHRFVSVPYTLSR